MRRDHPVLSEAYLQDVPLTNGNGIVAFLRHDETEDVLVLTNLDAAASTPSIQISQLLPLRGKVLSFTDLLTGDTVTARSRDGSSIAIDLGGCTTRLLLLSKNIRVSEDFAPAMQVTSNPTSGAFVVGILSSSGATLSITLVNAQGRIVLTQQRKTTAGANHLSFNISHLPSGIYFLRADDGVTKTSLRVLKLR